MQFATLIHASDYKVAFYSMAGRVWKIFTQLKFRFVCSIT